MTPICLNSATLAETRTYDKAPPLRRRALSGLTAVAVALSLLVVGAMPARADRNEDLAKALAAIAVLGIIVNEASKDKHKPKPDPVGHARVPEICAIEIATGERAVTVYAEQCLRKEGIKQQLPQRCAGTIRIYGKRDRIYSAQCLRDAGFRVGRREY